MASPRWAFSSIIFKSALSPLSGRLVLTMQGGFSILKWTALQCANGNPGKQRLVECSRLAQNRIQPGRK